MENCLVTKLKGVVDNSSLEKLGDVYFSINGTAASASISGITFNAKTPFDIYVEGDGYFADSFADLDVPASRKTRQTISGQKKLYFCLGPYKVHISYKYDITEFNTGTSGTAVIIDTEIFKSSLYMTRVTLSSTPCAGHLSDFSSMTLLNTLEVQGTSVSGNISALSNCVNLTKLDIHSNSHINGTIESMASGQVSAGRTSGTLQIISNGVITYNGTAMANNTTKTVRFGTSMVNPTTAETTQGYQVA